MSHPAEHDHEGIALVQAILARKAAQDAQDAPDTWTTANAPGGWVCDACGLPTESEPCPEHQPYAYGRMVSA